MSDTLRPYKDLFPEIGQRVMIDRGSYEHSGWQRSSRNPQVFIQSTRQPINHWRRCYRWP